MADTDTTGAGKAGTGTSSPSPEAAAKLHDLAGAMSNIVGDNVLNPPSRAAVAEEVTNGQEAEVGGTPEGEKSKVDVGSMSDEELENASTLQVGFENTDKGRELANRRAKVKAKEEKEKKSAKYEPDKTEIKGDDIIKYIYEKYWLAFLEWNCDNINKGVLYLTGKIGEGLENLPDWIDEKHREKEEGRRLNLLAKALRANEQTLTDSAKKNHDIANRALNIAEKMATNGGKFPDDERNALAAQLWVTTPTGGSFKRPDIEAQLNLIDKLQQDPSFIQTLPALAGGRVDTAALVDAISGKPTPEAAAQVIADVKKANDASFQTTQKLVHAATELSLADLSQHLELIDRGNLIDKVNGGNKDTINMILTGKDKDGNPVTITDENGQQIPIGSFGANMQALKGRLDNIPDNVEITDQHIEAFDKFLDETATRAEAINQGNKDYIKENKSLEGYKAGNDEELAAIHALKPNFPQPDNEQENVNDNQTTEETVNSNVTDDRTADPGAGDSGTGTDGDGEAGSNSNNEEEPITHKDLSQLALGSNENNVVMIMANKMKNPNLDEQTRDMMEKVRKAYNSHDPEQIAKLNEGINSKEDAEVANKIAEAIEQKNNVEIPDVQKKETEEKETKEKENKEAQEKEEAKKEANAEQEPSAQPTKTFEEQKKETMMALIGDYSSAMQRGDKAEAERIQALMAEEATKLSPEEIAAEEKRKKAEGEFYKKATEINKAVNDAEVAMEQTKETDKAIQNKLDKMQLESDKRHSKETFEKFGLETTETKETPKGNEAPAQENGFYGYTATSANAGFMYDYQGTFAGQPAKEEAPKKEEPKAEMTPEEREKATNKMVAINNALKNSKGMDQAYVDNLKKQMEELKAQGIELPGAPKKEEPEVSIADLPKAEAKSQEKSDDISAKTATVDAEIEHNQAKQADVDKRRRRKNKRKEGEQERESTKSSNNARRTKGGQEI